jgi:hypothetical protein
MAKLKLVANPTFIAKVGIPVAGATDADVTFTFRHRTKAELEDWVKESGDDVKMILSMATAWDLDEQFNEDTVGVLVQNYMGAPEVIVTAYMKELLKAREKN